MAERRPKPVLCKKSRDEERRKEWTWKSDARKRSDGARSGKTPKREEGKEVDEQTTPAFAIFALRDLKANETVVLGWEWDDGNTVYTLPALLQTGHMFL